MFDKKTYHCRSPCVIFEPVLVQNPELATRVPEGTAKPRCRVRIDTEMVPFIRMTLILHYLAVLQTIEVALSRGRRLAERRQIQKDSRCMVRSAGSNFQFLERRKPGKIKTAAYIAIDLKILDLWQYGVPQVCRNLSHRAIFED